MNNRNTPKSVGRLKLQKQSTSIKNHKDQVQGNKQIFLVLPKRYSQRQKLILRPRINQHNRKKQNQNINRVQKRHQNQSLKNLKNFENSVTPTNALLLKTLQTQQQINRKLTKITEYIDSEGRTRPYSEEKDRNNLGLKHHFKKKSAALRQIEKIQEIDGQMTPETLISFGNSPQKNKKQQYKRVQPIDYYFHGFKRKQGKKREQKRKCKKSKEKDTKQSRSSRHSVSLIKLKRIVN